MGFLKSIFSLFLILGIGTVAITYYWLHFCHNEPELPKVEGLWWGKGPKGAYKEDESLRKFVVNVSNKTLQELTARLKNTIYPEPLEDVDFEYGFNPNHLRKVVDYWLTTYDWRKQEAFINSYDHFKTQIDGIDIHYVHVKPKKVPSGVKVLPIIMVHGWPGSFIEFIEIIPLLTKVEQGKKFVFEIICPSIPGYAFSEPAHRQGLGALETAAIFNKLMHRLGFPTYYAQGGDWGSLVVTNMAILYPKSVKGVHVNVAFVDDPRVFFWWTLGSFFPTFVVDSKDYSKLYPMADKFYFILEESGYMHIQATKPDTVGIGLTNSPAGLAAYILEKFSTWTKADGRNHPDGLLTQKFTLDQLLNNVMIYYITGCITPSMRYYKENFGSQQAMQKTQKLIVKVPAGLAMFPSELTNMPESFTRYKFANLVSYTDMPRGGHFAAYEEPQLLAGDIWQFVTKVENLAVKN